MADHDPELWHAIGRLAMVVEKLDRKPVNLGGFFDSTPDDFATEKSKSYKAINGLIKKAGVDKGVVLKLLKEIDILLNKNQHDTSTEKVESMIAGLKEKKLLLEKAKAAVNELISGFDPYISTLTSMQKALVDANKSKVALNKAEEVVKKATDSVQKAKDALDKATEALKTAEAAKTEKTNSDASEINKCNAVVTQLETAEKTIDKVIESTKTALKAVGLSL